MPIRKCESRVAADDDSMTHLRRLETYFVGKNEVLIQFVGEIYFQKQDI